MARGMGRLRDMLAGGDELDAGSVLRAAGRALVMTVGGAAGPLYGTLLLDAADGFDGADGGTDARLAAALARGVVGVGRRGRSTVGQKTMLDALMPASAAFTEGVATNAALAGAARRAAEAARAGAEATRPLVAQRGRASYLGERAIGHLDPGAVSSAILIEALAAVAAQPAGSGTASR